MADALKTQEQDPAARELSFLERLALLVDHQWNWRQNQALVRRLHLAKLRGNVCVSARARPLTNIDASNHMTELARQTVGAIGFLKTNHRNGNSLRINPIKSLELGLGAALGSEVAFGGDCCSCLAIVSFTASQRLQAIAMRRLWLEMPTARTAPHEPHTKSGTEAFVPRIMMVSSLAGGRKTARFLRISFSVPGSTRIFSLAIVPPS